MDVQLNKNALTCKQVLVEKRSISQARLAANCCVAVPRLIADLVTDQLKGGRLGYLSALALGLGAIWSDVVFQFARPHSTTMH